MIKYDNIVPRMCGTCGTWNLPKFVTCITCKAVLVADNEVRCITFCDIEHAVGSWSAHPIQIGLVQFDFRLRRIMGKLQINMRIDGEICPNSAYYSHGLRYTRDKAFLVDWKGVKLPTVPVEEAARLLEEFISSSQYLMCHGDNGTDFTTLQNWFLEKGLSHDEYDKQVKINTSSYFKVFTFADFPIEKSGMKTIMSRY